MIHSRIRNTFSLVTLQSILSDLSHLVALERLGPVITERILWQADTQQPRIALTFDDGPHPENTPRLLEVLNKTSVPATFFLIGQHITAHFRLAQQIVAAGHETANHTFTHPLLWKLNDQEILSEIERTDTLLRDLNGAHPQFLRPPMGLFSKRVLDVVEQAGYQTVVGDVYPRDPHLPGKDKIVRRVLHRVENGSIIILHDGGNFGNTDRSQTIAAVEEFIPILKERGLEFVKLSELLF
ncbi:MAG: polysaccharide deacetylase family protein [bacterium]